MLHRLQGLAQAALVFFVVMFPGIACVFEFTQQLAPHSGSVLVSHFINEFDAGGQSPISRAALFSLLALLSVFGLLLPLDSTKSKAGGWRSKPWGLTFLLLGLLSIAVSSRFFVSIQVWLSWALVLATYRVLKQSDSKAPQIALVGSLYSSALLLYLHALWLAVPATSGRFGGIFHHSNILSTYCLMILPFLIWRAKSNGVEAWLASFLAGAILATQIWTGSLTGACVLAFALGSWAGRNDRSSRWLLAMVASGAVLSCNFVSSLAWAQPLLFLALLTLAVFRQRRNFPKSSVIIFALSLAIALGSFLMLAPENRHEGVVHRRDTSGAARIQFYTSGFQMWAEAPVLGQGPGSFAREYPRFQPSIRYYSKFVHCLPLELGLEWGLPALICLLAGIASIWRKQPDEKAVVTQWATGLFVLHSLTGVQSQFPYLLALLALSWSFVSSPSPERTEHWWGALTRVCLSLVLLSSLSLFAWQMAAAFDRSVALKLYKERGLAASIAVEGLLSSSAAMYPGDGITWFQWGTILQQQRQFSDSLLKAEAAITTDPDWAAPRHLKMTGAPTRITLNDIEEALAIDPINYPAFYREQARLAHLNGNTKLALETLESQGSKYDQRLLDTLPTFRSDDLKEQLVEYWLLAAILAESLEDPKGSERYFRQALQFSEGRTLRIRKLLAYPQHAQLVPGPFVGDLLQQVFEQVPSQDFPAPVQSTSD